MSCEHPEHSEFGDIVKTVFHLLSQVDKITKIHYLEKSHVKGYYSLMNQVLDQVADLPYEIRHGLCTSETLQDLMSMYRDIENQFYCALYRTNQIFSLLSSEWNLPHKFL